MKIFYLSRIMPVFLLCLLYSVSASATLTVTITDSTNVYCYGGSNGSATATAIGGVTPYTYAWSNGQTTSIATGLSSGAYTLMVIDSVADTAYVNVNVVQPIPFSAIMNAPVNVSCYGGSNGSATIIAINGTMPYTYLWSGGGGTLATANNLITGGYTVTVSDNCNESVSASVSIAQPRAAISITDILTDVSCFGDSNGDINITRISGGTLPYTLIWSNNVNSDNNDNLTAGSYTLTITDNNGCNFIDTISVSQPPVLLANDSVGYNACGNTCKVSGIGGTSPYNYLWNSGQTTSTVSNLSKGSYTITITDAHGCTSTASLSVTNPPVFSLSLNVVNVTCTGDNNGNAKVTVSGGGAPYTYSWAPITNTTAAATGLSPGGYTITITDSSGCNERVVFSIIQPAALTATLTPINISCFGETNGAINATANGGTSPYTYSWNTKPIQTNAEATGLSVGNYKVIVSDHHSCIYTASASISQPPLLTVTSATLSTACGSITNASASGGTPMYFYQWSNGATASSIPNFPAGTYTVTASDNNGCTATASVTITHAPVMSVMTIPVNLLCNGATNGIAEASASGGILPYTYLWNDGATTTSISDLSAGAYTITITDNNGCSQSAAAIITQPAALVATQLAVNVTCNGDANGVAGVMASGGTMPYAYLWLNGATTSSINNLRTGLFFVTVTDSNNCMANVFVSITQPSALSTLVLQSPDTCYGYDDGTASVALSGATPPYQWAWSNGATTSSLTQLTAGSYTCTVTDNNGCTDSSLIIINQPLPLACDSFITGYSTARVFPTGGIPIGDSVYYTYLWSNGTTTANILGVSGGVYTVCVTSPYGCGTTCAIDTIPGPVGIQSLTDDDGLFLYPNPSDGQFTIAISNEQLKISKVEVYNMLGEMVFSQLSIINYQLSIDLSTQPDGVYFVRMITGSGAIINRKLSIQR